MSEEEVRAKIEKIAGVDINSKHVFVGREVGWPLQGSFWEVLGYDAVIETSVIGGKVAALCFWTRNDFSFSKSYRDDLRQPALSLTFDPDKKTVAVEMSGFLGPKDPFLPILDEKVNPLLFPTDARYPEPEVIYAPSVLYPIEMRSSAAISGEVKLFIKAEDGHATRVAVAGASQSVFIRYAIANALLTVWKTNSKNEKLRDGWFVRTITFVRGD